MARLRWLWFALLLVAFALWWARRAPPQPVKVETLQPGTAVLALSVSGRVRATSQTPIAPLSAGRLNAVLVAEGEAVRAGQPLARLTLLGQAAQDAQATANLAVRETALKQAERALARDSALFEQGFVSAAVRDERRDAVAATRAEVARARAALAEQAARSGGQILTAPFDAVVLRRLADALRPGLPARILWQGRTWPAQLSDLAPDVDPASGGRLIRVRPDAALDAPIGRSMDITIEVATLPNQITVPRSALLRGTEAGAATVKLLQGEAAETRSIRYRDWPAERVIVTAGLKAGEQLILDPRAVPVGRLRADTAASETR
jgi:HlyD family secretion protein